MSEQVTFQATLHDFTLLVGDVKNETVTLNNGTQLMPGLGMVDAAAFIQEYFDTLSQNITNIIILGQFNVGKTTLLNALMGSDRLPTDNLPTTAVITRVVYGKSQMVHVIKRSNRQQITWEAFQREFQLSQEDIDSPEDINRFHDIDYVEIELQNPLLQNGVSFIDTPGLGEHWMRTRVTLRYLRQTQAVLFVLDANHLLSTEERSLIKMIGNLNVDHVFFVVNRINLVDPKSIPEIQAWLKNALKKYFTDEKDQFNQQLYDSRVFFLDARRAQRAQQQEPTDQEALEESKLLELMSQLKLFLKIEQRQKAAQRAAVRNMVFISAAACERICFFRNVLSQPLDKAEQMAKTAEARLEMLEMEMANLCSLLENMTDKIKYSLYADMLRYVADMQFNWEEDSARLIELDPSSILKLYTSNKGREEFNECFEVELRKYLEIKFTEWADRSLKQIGVEVEDLYQRFEQRTHDFSVGLAEAENLFSGNGNKKGSSTQLLIQSLLERLKFNNTLESPFHSDLVGDAQAVVERIVTTLIMSNWLVSVGGFLTPIRNKLIEKAQKHLFTGLKTELFDALRNEISDKKDELYTQIDADFSRLNDKVMEEFQGQVNRVRDDIIRLKNYIAEHGDSVENERQRLESVEKEILYALNNLLQEAYQKSITKEELDEAIKADMIEELLPEMIAEGPLQGIIPELPAMSSEKWKETELSPEQCEQIARQIGKRALCSMGLLPGRKKSTEFDCEVAKLSPELAGLIGLENVKERVLELMYFIQEEKRRLGEDRVDLPTLHLVFTGNPGTGKTTVARIIGKIYRQIGFLKKGEVHEVNVNDLTSRYVGDTTKEAEKHFKEALDQVLFIDEAYQLVSDGINYRGEVVDMLVHYAENYRDRLSIILAGYPEEMIKFLDSNPGLRRRFPNIIEFPDYQPNELLEIFHKMLAETKLTVSEAANSQLTQVIEGMYALRRRGFGNAGEMRNLLDGLKRRRALRVQHLSLLKDAPIESEDIPSQYKGFVFNPVDQPDNILKELDDFIGMHTFKEEIKIWAGQLQYQQKFNKKQQKAPLRHMVFRGNPGTGKTSVARVMGRIFKSLGILRNDIVKEVSSSNLIAEYRGQAGPQTRKIIEEALDGVLFIDEAYSLYAGRYDDEQGDYGAEVIKELVLAMENYRDRLVVILAGYPAKIDRLLDANEGLRSRIPNKFNFPDYSPDELMQIFWEQVHKEGYTLSEAAEVKVRSIIQKMYYDRDKTFGNGRAVETLFRKIEQRQNYRVVNLPDSHDLDVLKDRIEPEDVSDYTPNRSVSSRTKVITVDIDVPVSSSEREESSSEILYVRHPATDRWR